MKRNIYLMAALATVLLAACGDDKNEGQMSPLSDPVVRMTTVTSSTLAFEWDAVEGAVQYGYRLTDLDGEDIIAGVTKQHSAEADGLQPFTTYTVTVSAFPTEVGSALASTTTFDIPTLFYEAVVDRQTNYTSHLQANMSTTRNKGTINEDREYDGYVENTYGRFTITKFYGVTGYDMVFDVNRDNTITILNGTRLTDDDGEDTRIVEILTGKAYNAKSCYDKIYIDESSAWFNGPEGMLTFSAYNNGTGNTYKYSSTETISW